MLIAIILGALLGVLGFLPLVWGFSLARKATATSNLGQAGALLLGVLGSFVILAVSLVVCIAVFREMTLPFVLAMALGLVVAAVVFGINKQLR